MSEKRLHAVIGHLRREKNEGDSGKTRKQWEWRNKQSTVN
jgi:hypothetical protein